MSSLALLIALCVAPAAQALFNSAKAGRILRHSTEAVGFVKATEFKHKLRVCNAYPSSEDMELFKNTQEKLTEEPLNYKHCADFNTPLISGDKLNFKVGSANAGTFSIAELPRSDSILLLVVHRHDTLSTAVSFESHVFANLLNAQVAVIDTYKGAKKSFAKIQDHPGQQDSRVEDLRYNSVVALEPGVFEVGLFSGNGTEEAKSPLVALKQESYVVLRTGVEPDEGDAYPESIVVYPHSDPALLSGGATSMFAAPFSLLGALAAFWCLQ